MAPARRTHTYTVHLEPAEEGGYVVTVPALPGCVTQGETYEEALAMAREAIEGWLDVLARHGTPIPEEPRGRDPIDVAVEVPLPMAV
jgi:antitoxin HicB